MEAPVRVAIIGAGFMGSLYGRICNQMCGVEVTAVCDIALPAAEKAAGECGARAYTDSTRMLEQEPSDAVLVCTPEDAHCDPTLSALAAEKHVMVEKPLAANVAEATLMERAAFDRTNLVCMTAHSLRFDPRYAALRESVASGQIGDIINVAARRTPPFTALERVRGRTELPFWVGVHDIDMMHWVVQSDVSRVVAVSTGIGLEAGGLKRAILATLVFATGTIAMLDNSWGPHCESPAVLSTAEFRVQGTRGAAVVTAHEQGLSLRCGPDISVSDTVYIHAIHGRIAGVYANQMQHFIDCIRQRKPAQVTFRDGLEAVRVADAILRALRTSAPVVISEATN